LNEELKSILKALVDEIEDLRAHQVVSSVTLSCLPSLETTKFDELKSIALSKNQESYEKLRREIDAAEF